MISKVYAYNRFSVSAKVIADALGVKRIKHTNSRWRPRHDSVVLNWGSSSLPIALGNARVVNDPASVKNASDKLMSFTIMSAGEIPIPEFTTSYETAREWTQEGVVICRTLTRASSGRGIVVAETAEEVVQAPLYTKYFKRKDEYRVHVVHGEVIDVQRKMRKTDVPDEDVNWKIRNHSNGFIFGRGGVVAPEHVIVAARLAVNSLGLDVGAVDIGYNERQNKACVFEVNTAPGIEGSTIEKYIQALKRA